MAESLYSGLEEDWSDKLMYLSNERGNSDNQNFFSYLTLCVLLFGSEADQEKIVDLFSKSGVLHHRRMILSRARYVYTFLKKNNFVPIKTSSDYLEYTYEQILGNKIKEPLFNVSSSYRTIKNMKEDCDIEKSYSNEEIVEKLRRLADCIENDTNFEIQVAGERIYVPARAVFSIEHEREGGDEELEFQFKWSNA